MNFFANLSRANSVEYAFRNIRGIKERNITFSTSILVIFERKTALNHGHFVVLRLSRSNRRVGVRDGQNRHKQRRNRAKASPRKRNVEQFEKTSCTLQLPGFTRRNNFEPSNPLYFRRSFSQERRG